MTTRQIIFCDICNPSGIRVIENRRAFTRPNEGRRLSDGRAWFGGSENEALANGWRIVGWNRHVCPHCIALGRYHLSPYVTAHDLGVRQKASYQPDYLDPAA